MFWFNRDKYIQDDIKILMYRNKKSHLRYHFQTNAKNSKIVWSKINEILNRKKT